MPTYEYECKKCFHRFEEFQSITAQPLSKCPKCRGAVRRLVGGGIGIIFKGSGFYSTDNKKSSVTTGTSKAESNSSDSGSRDNKSKENLSKDVSSGASSNDSGSKAAETNVSKTSK